MGWEAILNATEPQDFVTAFPNSNRTVGAYDVRSVSLVPINVTRGTVTMLRVRGSLEVYFFSTNLAAALSAWNVHLIMQLVPASDGGPADSSYLSPGNSADQESNRIVWQRVYYANTGTTITGPGGVEYHTSTLSAEVDVKVKRRFDRATWALELTAEIATASNSDHLIAGQLRGLFSTADGI